MEFKYKLTENVKGFIEGAKLCEIEIGCSNAQVIRIEKVSDIFFLKISNTGEIKKEYEKLKWLDEKVKIPEVILYDTKDTIEYLITKKVPGEMLCSDYYLENWKLGIPALVEAFQELHRVDIDNCPFDTRLSYKLELVKNNIDKKLLNVEDISTDVLIRFKTLENIYHFLLENKFEEELCFTHGDVSLPNVFAYQNKFSGFIDIGECGIADKWFDLAIAVKTLKRNYGKEAVNYFFEQLEIQQDKEKIDYYLLLMELYL